MFNYCWRLRHAQRPDGFFESHSCALRLARQCPVEFLMKYNCPDCGNSVDFRLGLSNWWKNTRVCSNCQAQVRLHNNDKAMAFSAGIFLVGATLAGKFDNIWLSLVVIFLTGYLHYRYVAAASLAWTAQHPAPARRYRYTGALGVVWLLMLSILTWRILVLH